MSYNLQNYNPVEVRFAYKKSSGLTWTNTDWVSKSVSGTYGKSISGLTPNTLYDFRAELTYGTEIQGSVLQLTTNMPGPAATVTLTAVPSSIAANGTSHSDLTATVTDVSGNAVTDGTVVLFTTSKGVIGGVTTTADGVATATLTSATGTQIVIADVSASANSVSKMIAVFFTPPSTPPITENTTTTVTGPGTIPGTATGGSVTVGADAGSQHTVTTVKYGNCPAGTPTFAASSGIFYDVHVDNTVGLNSITIQFSPATASTFIEYWTGTFWRRASQQTNSGGVVTVTVTATTFPNLTDLSGLFFGSGIPTVDPPAPAPESVNPLDLFTPPSHGASMPAVTTPQAPVTLPNIQIQSAGISAKTVTPGTPITVTADIANRSAVNGNKKVTLYVNGQVETTQAVTVNSGSSSKLTFNVSRSEPGDYAVYVDGVPAGSFKVEMVTGNDLILIFSVSLIALAFICGLVMLWRRQRSY
jgi:adhesin/invasin